MIVAIMQGVLWTYTVNQLILASDLFSRLSPAQKLRKYKSSRICKTWIFPYVTTSNELDNREIKSPRSELERAKREIYYSRK